MVKKQKKVSNKPKTTIEQKISVAPIILESRNKNYKKVTHNHKVTYVVIDKKTNAEKRLSAKQFAALKKKTTINEPVKRLQTIYQITKDHKGFISESTGKTYKKYQDENKKFRWIQYDKDGNIDKTYSYKQGLAIFKKIRNDKTVNNIKTAMGLSRPEAKSELNRRKAYVKENQIQGIMIKENLDRGNAIKFYNKLIRKPTGNLKLSKYYRGTS